MYNMHYFLLSSIQVKKITQPSVSVHSDSV